MPEEVKEVNGSNGASAQNTAPDVDYDKLADIVSKRSATTEDSVLKGYFKEQGMSQEEMGAAIKQFKDNQSTKKNEEATRQQKLMDENTKLRDQILNTTIDSRINALAAGVQAAKIPYLTKLINRSELSDKDGKVDDEKVKAAIEAVCKDFPDFKDSTESGSGVKKIGGDGNSSASEEAEKKMRKAFGLK